MDRHILIGAVLLLIFEVTVLLGDLEIIPFKLIKFEQQISAEKSIGTVVEIKEKVRKRSLSSIFWETTQKSDELYSYDSILTLENSSSEINLEGDIKIQLHENTLVVLEPKSETEQGAFKLKFDRGDIRSRNNTQKFKVGSGEWVIEAKQGSDLSVKSVTNNNIELEVRNGEAIVNNPTKQISEKKITQGERAILQAKKGIDILQIDSDLKFKNKEYMRIYSHNFPINYHIDWEGNAEKLRILTPNKKLEFVTLAEKTNSFEVQLEPGSYYFNLENKNKTSESMAVHVWPAPKITYFSPLPRDRVTTGSTPVFSWSPLDIAASYQVRFSRDESLRLILNTEGVKTTPHPMKMNENGSFFWSVFGYDDKNFIIPPQYGYPIYSVPDPLAPPQLIQPTLRKPSSTEGKKDTPKKTIKKHKKLQSMIELLFDLYFQKAHAQIAGHYKGDLLFQWLKVQGADYYTVEISSNPDFRNPDVIVNVDHEKFVWQNYKQEIYYWRVAAGQKSGRMGLFSEVQKLDLKNLSNLNNQEISPGVKIVKAKKIEVKQPVVQPPPQDWAPIQIDTHKTQSNHYTAGLGIYYDFGTYKNSGNITAALTGLTVANFDFKISFPKGFEDSSWNLLANYNRVLWKPNTATDFPFQNNLIDDSYGISYMYNGAHSSWYYGARVEKFSFLSRDDLENLKLQNYFAYGFAGAMEIQQSASWRTLNMLHVLFGGGLVEIYLQNEAIYRFYQTNGTVNFDLSFQLNARMFNGSGTSGYLIQPGVFYRVDW